MRSATAGLLMLLWATPAAAQLRHLSDREEWNRNSSQLTFDHALEPGADRLLVVAVTTTGASAEVVSLSHGGKPLSRISQIATPGGNCRVEWWAIVNPPEGNQTFQLMLSQSTAVVSASLVHYAGADVGLPVGAAASASGSVAPSSVTVASDRGELALDATCGWSPASVIDMAGSNQTARWHWSTGSLSAAGTERPGAAPSVTLTWTESATGMEWASTGISLRPAGVPWPPLDLEVDTVGCAVGPGGPRPGARNPPAGALLLAIVLGTFALRSRETPRLMRPSTSLAPEPRGTPPDLDRVTLERAKAGDPAAQTALVHRYERPVFSLLWRMVGPQRALVEDLTQETFLRVLRGLSGFTYDGRARPITWILAIATRLALDHLRNSRPRRDTASAPGSIPVSLPRPDQDVHRRALAVALVQAVDNLGPPFRAAFLLREVHGLAYDEIAQALSIDIGTVKSRLARARALLQAALAEMHDD